MNNEDEETRCPSDFIDATVDCDLPAGHKGDHIGTIAWENLDDPV